MKQSLRLFNGTDLKYISEGILNAITSYMVKTAELEQMNPVFTKYRFLKGLQWTEQH